MRRSQGRPFTEREIQRIIVLLRDTDMSMTAIAEAMSCVRSSICSLNRKYLIREYKSRRSSWVVHSEPAGQHVRSSF